MDHRVVDALVENFGDPGTSGDEFVWNCPFSIEGSCSSKRPDTRRRFFVNPSKKKWFCQNCAVGGSLSSLFSKMGIKLNGAEVSRWDEWIVELRSSSFDVDLLAESEEADPRPIEYPCDVFDVERGSPAYNYLVAVRGISPKDIEFHRMVQGTESWVDRVFIPTFDINGDMVFWQARSFRGTHPAKYLGAKVPKSRIIFNYDAVAERVSDGTTDTVVVCEGTLTAISCGPNAVAVFGKSPARSQLRMVGALKAKRYIVALDGDAMNKAKIVSRRLASMIPSSSEVYVARFPEDQDANDLDTEEVQDVLEDASPASRTSTWIGS